MLNTDFASIYDAYYQDVYLYLMKLTNGRKDLAEELTQETFYQVFISIHRFKGDSKIKTWITEIAKHTCFNYFKKNRIMDNIEDSDWERSSSSQMKPVEAYLLKAEQQEELRSAILSLEKKYRDVVLYRVYYELSFQKVGQLLRISENSAKVLFFRAKTMIKKKMEG